MFLEGAIGDVFVAIRKKIQEYSMPVGDSSNYPRMELHSFVENEPLCKDMTLRSVTLTIEVMHDRGLGDAVQWTNTNFRKLFQEGIMQAGNFLVIGILPGQSRLFQEANTEEGVKTLYRMLQDVTVIVKQNI